MTENRAAALAELTDLAVLEVTGKDRTRFLQGMCTQDIKALEPGAGRLAAFATRQGKMVAMGVARVTESSVLFTLDRGRLRPLIDHLSKFIVTEDVALKDSGLRVLYLYGAGAAGLSGADGLAAFHHRGVKEGLLVSPNETLAGDGHDLLVEPGRIDAVRDRFTAEGAGAADAEDLEALRITGGFPRWGVDIDEDLLPMEAGLDDLAISYTKGCYIGQEVIQRVKTYSEPPRSVVSLRFDDGPEVSAGSEVSCNGAPIGKVTSASGASAIALVRKEHKTPGTRVSAGGRDAEVAAARWRHRLTQ